MSFRGVYRDGVIVLQDGVVLREGTVVEVVRAESRTTPAPVRKAPARSAKPTARKTGKKPARTKRARPAPGWLAEALGPHFGSIKGLPRDAAENHDHYLYGTPKRKP
jgi:ABC-type glutathione transport system ATPase component